MYNQTVRMAKRACGFVIFRRSQGSVEYLLLQKLRGLHYWTPPKGHVEAEEDDMQTALRETREESGFQQEDLKIFDDCKIESVYMVRGFPKTVIYWVAELINQDRHVRLSREHRAFEWLTIDDACDYAEHEALQKVLRQADKYITNIVLTK